MHAAIGGVCADVARRHVAMPTTNITGHDDTLLLSQPRQSGMPAPRGRHLGRWPGDRARQVHDVVLARMLDHL